MIDEKLSILETALTEFLLGKKSIFETAQIFQSTIKTTKPLDRISTILQTPDVPIPNFSGMFIPPGNLNSNIGPNSQRKKTRSWTEYEDQRLLAGIHKFGTDNWVSVAAFVGNGRTRAQCSQRWTRGLDPRISKDKWSSEDEESLMRLVIQYGTKSWTRIAQEIGNRSDVQCRYHYKQMKQEMDLDSDSSSGIANSSNVRLLNLQPSSISASISASNSATLPTLPNLLDQFPSNQHQVQSKGYFGHKDINVNTTSFKNSLNVDMIISDDATPRKISASGSLPACLSLAMPRNPESTISPHFGAKLNSSNNRNFVFQQQFQAHPSKGSNKVDLPSINDLLNDVSMHYPIEKSIMPISSFENSSYLSTSNNQSNKGRTSNNNINMIGNQNNLS